MVNIFLKLYNLPKIHRKIRLDFSTRYFISNQIRIPFLAIAISADIKYERCNALLILVYQPASKNQKRVNHFWENVLLIQKIFRWLNPYETIMWHTTYYLYCCIKNIRKSRIFCILVLTSKFFNQLPKSNKTWSKSSKIPGKFGSISVFTSLNYL